MLKNGIYNVVPAILRVILGAISVPILIRLLGIDEYGLWTLTSAFINIVALADAGLSMSTTVFISRDLAHDKYVDQLSETLTLVVGGMLILATIALFGVWMIAPTIIQFFPNIDGFQSQNIIPAFRLAGIVVWLRLMQQSMIGIEQAYQRYDVMNFITAAQLIASNVGLIVISYGGGHILELMQYTVAISFITLVFHIGVSRSILHGVSIRIRWDKYKAAAIAHYSMMTWIGSLGGVLFGALDRVIVGFFLGTTALGIYSAITTVTVQINSISSLPVKPLLPVLTQKLLGEQKTESDQVESLVRKSFQLNTAIALGIGGVFITTAPFLLSILIGDFYSPTDIIAFRMAAAIYAIYSVNAVGYYILFSLNEVRMFMTIQLSSSLLSLLLIAFGAKFFGLLGATIGNAGYLGVWLFTIYSMKKLNIRPARWIKWIKYPIAWFILFSLLSIFSGNSSGVMLSLVLAQGITIFIWVIQSQNIRFNQITGLLDKSLYSRIH